MVQAVRTLLSPLEALDAIWHAHQDVIGGPCEVTLLETLAAQSAFETLRWKACWCFNLGNIRGAGDAGTMTLKGADEIIDGHHVTGPEVEAGFAAYLSRASGARAFVRFLGTASKPPAPNRFQKAWDAARAGDIDTYVAELHAHGYFTASIARYKSGLLVDLNWLRQGPLPQFLESLKVPP